MIVPAVLLKEVKSMKDKCIRCGGPADHPVKALEVRTLHVRSLSGERRVQALGDEMSSAVCDRCAREQLVLALDPVRAAKKHLVSFGAVFIAGLLIVAAAFLFLKGKKVFVLLGLAAVVCGVLGIADALHKARKKRNDLRNMPENEALEEAAWDVFTAEAPKKENENDLTYIPVNEQTLRRKNGDLMILYHLLPEIAVQAWDRLHGKTAEQAAPQSPENQSSETI